MNSVSYMIVNPTAFFKMAEEYDDPFALMVDAEDLGYIHTVVGPLANDPQFMEGLLEKDEDIEN